MNCKTFETFRSSSTGRRAQSLLNTRDIKLRDLFDEVFTQVMESAPYMVNGEKCTTEQLCGSEMWEDLGIGPQRAAGMCLAYLVAEELVPLFAHYVNSDAGKNHYCNQPSVRPQGTRSSRITRVHIQSTGVAGTDGQAIAL